MDISFLCGSQKFNYRVCAIMISDHKILAMRDERSPYFYLPGGRVAMGETAEQAVVREVEEELSITPKIIRPLWLSQAFFTEEVDNLRYHELCIYFFDGRYTHFIIMIVVCRNAKSASTSHFSSGSSKIKF